MVDFKKLSAKLQAHLTPPDAESKVAPAEGATCKECVMGSPIYVPCGKPAEYMIQNRNERNPMCAMCADHNVRNRGASYMRKSAPLLPNIMPGHWDSSAGFLMAARYATMTREQLCGGDLTDSNVAFKTAMVGRNDLEFEASLSIARDRIRWLSVQLAIAKLREDRMRKRIDELRDEAKACAHDRTGDSYSYDTQADLLEEFLTTPGAA